MYSSNPPSSSYSQVDSHASFEKTHEPAPRVAVGFSRRATSTVVASWQISSVKYSRSNWLPFPVHEALVAKPSRFMHSSMTCQFDHVSTLSLSLTQVCGEVKCFVKVSRTVPQTQWPSRFQTPPSGHPAVVHLCPGPPQNCSPSHEITACSWRVCHS